MLLSEGLRLAVLGVAIGAMVAVGAGRELRTMLYGVTPGDPATVAAVAVMLLTVSTVAICVPAARAMRVDPVKALKWE